MWTSVINLSKVHAALSWLRENNHLYKDVPAYTIDDIKTIIDDKQEGRSEQTDSDGGFLQKLDEAAKSFLYEHFTLQPLCAEYPADAIVDYQMKKVSGQSMDVFDSNLDLMTFPELFPTGRNGMRDSLREVELGTSEFIKSRLLHKDSVPQCRPYVANSERQKLNCQGVPRST